MFTAAAADDRPPPLPDSIALEEKERSPKKLLHIHKALRHYSPERIRKLFVSAKLDPPLLVEFESAIRNCTACGVHKRKRPKPAASSKLVKKFNQMVGLDFVFLVWCLVFVSCRLCYRLRENEENQKQDDR